MLLRPNSITNNVTRICNVRHCVVWFSLPPKYLILHDNIHLSLSHGFMLMFKQYYINIKTAVPSCHFLTLLGLLLPQPNHKRQTRDQGLYRSGSCFASCTHHLPKPGPYCFIHSFIGEKKIQLL